MTNVEWALHCAYKGWLVFPSREKRPLVKWGTQATTDLDTIEGWWNAWPEADVCIKTGGESGLVVVDWDVYKQTTRDWPLTEKVPATYTVHTAKGGVHFYFKHPGYPVSNSAGLLAEFIDVRGDGGMVVAYKPSFNAPLAPVPETWVRKRETPTEPLAPIAAPYEGDGAGLALAVGNLAHYAQQVVDAPQGQRNLKLWQYTSDAFKMVAAGELREEIVLNLMTYAGETAGLAPDEVRASVQSGRARGMLEPTSCVDLYWKERGRA